MSAFRRSPELRYARRNMPQYVASPSPKPKRPQPLGLNSIPRFGKYKDSNVTVAYIFSNDRFYFNWAVEKGLFKAPTLEELQELGQ